MKRLSLRINDTESKKLTELSAKTGLNNSEILREVLDNMDEVSLKIITEDQLEKSKRDMELIATRKYLADLFSNATNNLNQIAKHCNQNKDLYVLYAEVIQLESKIDRLIKEVKSHEYY